jgi:hypothetical protein
MLDWLLGKPSERELSHAASALLFMLGILLGAGLGYVGTFPALHFLWEVWEPQNWHLRILFTIVVVGALMGASIAVMSAVARLIGGRIDIRLSESNRYILHHSRLLFTVLIGVVGFTWCTYALMFHGVATSMYLVVLLVFLLMIVRPIQPLWRMIARVRS